MKKFIVLLMGMFLVMAQSGMVSALTFDAIDKGAFSSDGVHWNDGATYTGQGSTCFYNSYFVFDLSSLTDPIESGQLLLELYEYESIDLSESFTVYDTLTWNEFSFPIYPPGSENGRDVFDDLGSGNVYGTATVSSSDVGSIINIILSEQAISDINSAAGDYWSIGITLLGPYTQAPETISFSDWSGTGTHQLDLKPVPEPMSILLLGGGLFGLAGFRRKLRKY